VRDFLCPHCGQRLVFENSRCLNCGNWLAFDLYARDFAIVGDDGITIDAPPRSRCANIGVAACNWLAPRIGGLCRSCALTRTRPADGDLAGLPQFAEAEAAKRRLVMELTELALPIVGRDLDPENGLCFDLLSSAHEQVMTGHDNGVITLDLAETDDLHREQLRISMAEPLPKMDHLGPSSKRCSATPTPTTRRRWTGTTPRVLRLAGQTSTSPPTPPCIRPRTGPKPSPTICTSATRSTPRRPSDSRQRVRQPIDRWPVRADSIASSSSGCRCRGR
jgi:hypothetical protein